MVSIFLRLPKLRAPEASSLRASVSEAFDKATSEALSFQDTYIKSTQGLAGSLPSFVSDPLKPLAEAVLHCVIKETTPAPYRKSPSKLLEGSLEDPSGGGMSAVMSPAHLKITDPMGSLHRLQDLMPQVKQNGHNLLEAAHQASSAIGSWANHLTDAAVTFLNSHHVTNAATHATNAIHHGLNVVG